MNHSNNSDLRKQKKKLLRLYLRDKTTKSKNKYKFISRIKKSSLQISGKKNFSEQQIGRKNKSQTFKIVKEFNSDENDAQQRTVDWHDLNYFF